MQTQPAFLFPHRLNREGSYDSICIVCHATVATERSEAELARHEDQHACSRIRLDEVDRYGYAPGSMEFL